MKQTFFPRECGRPKRLKLAMMIVSLFTTMFAWGQDVTYNQAKGIAVDFFKSHGVKSEAVVPQKAKRKAPVKNDANSPYYIFNSDNASAFVVVSGDSRTQQVLAYSMDGAFDEDNVAPGAAYMLEQYEEYINSLQDGANEPTTRANIDFGSGNLIETAHWNQSYDFWWSQCPIIGSSNTHAGCIATAMAILMRHYEWPSKGTGSKSYTTATNHLNLSANFGDTSYDWASFPKGNQTDPGWNDTNKSAVAKLLYQCGVAASMDYNTDGSGASSRNQAIALFRYFGYTLGEYITKDNVGHSQMSVAEA